MNIRRILRLRTQRPVILQLSPQVSQAASRLDSRRIDPPCARQPDQQPSPL